MKKCLIYLIKAKNNNSYDNNYFKIRVNSDGDLSSEKTLKMYDVVILRSWWYLDHLLLLDYCISIKKKNNF